MSYAPISAFEYHTPEMLAQEHYDHEFNARYDYLQEAFGDEARLLAEQDADEARFWAEEQEKDEAKQRGITVEALREECAIRRANEIEAAKCQACRDRIESFFIPF